MDNIFVSIFESKIKIYKISREINDFSVINFILLISIILESRYTLLTIGLRYSGKFYFELK